MIILKKGRYFFYYLLLHILLCSRVHFQSNSKWFWKYLFPSPFHFISGFSIEGHEAIGMTAMSGLGGEQLYELKKLLSGKDLVDVGKWGHLIHEKIPNAEKMHFNLQDGSCANINFTCEDENGLCLLNSIKHFYYALIKTSDSKVDKETSNIKFHYPRNIVFTDTDRLKYLVSLLSDMHQPLRLGFLRDNGGKSINVIDRTIDYEEKKTTLFNYVETEMIDKMVLKYSNSWYSGWTHVNRIFADHKKDEALFEALGIDVIDVWAKEIITDFCEEFYLRRHLSNIRDDEGIESFINTEREVRISIELEYQLERLIRYDILRAGSRIAIILNDIFTKKKFESLRKRSEFDKVSDEALKSSKISNVYQKNALFINLSILLIILIIIFYVNILINKRTQNRLPTKMEAELQEKCN